MTWHGPRGSCGCCGTDPCADPDPDTEHTLNIDFGGIFSNREAYPTVTGPCYKSRTMDGIFTGTASFAIKKNVTIDPDNPRFRLVDAIGIPATLGTILYRQYDSAGNITLEETHNGDLYNDSTTLVYGIQARAIAFEVGAFVMCPGSLTLTANRNWPPYATWGYESTCSTLVPAGEIFWEIV